MVQARGASNVPARTHKLTDTEYDIIKQHAAIGAELLVGVSPAFHEIAIGVRHHHERWDGQGYPGGLAQRDIPVFGRILSVVDVFEAMMSDRPYRKAIPVEDARAILEAEAGAQLDPDRTELFLTLEAEGKIHIEGRDGKHTGMEAPDHFNPAALLGEPWPPHPPPGSDPDAHGRRRTDHDRDERQRGPSHTDETTTEASTPGPQARRTEKPPRARSRRTSNPMHGRVRSRRP